MALLKPFAGSFLFLLFFFQTIAASDVSILLAFKATISDPTGSLSKWTAADNSGPCTRPTWPGIICIKGEVYGLQLENMTLSGKLDLTPLGELSTIRTLSFANNSFEGPMPDLQAFEGLKGIYLTSNKLSGEIADDAFKGMKSLKIIDLSRNEFTGRIPSSIVGDDALAELMIQYNQFNGEIPDLQQKNLKVVNVSHNNLEGKIPEGISKMDVSMFAGNKDLCGLPLSANCKPLPPPESPHKKPAKALVIAIAVIGVLVVLAIIWGLLSIFCRGQQSSKDIQNTKKVESFKTDNVEQGGANWKKTAAAAPIKEEKEQKLIFVGEDQNEKFELQDLLRASAEVLGNGEFGSSYKASLLNGASVVVKRFKDMNKIGKEEFEEHMRRLGKLSHPNLLPLVAYYYRREEKLLVTDYIPNGSLAALLHGNRDSNTATLDWAVRLKIVKGIARGLAYLYEELPMLNIPHGHLKSSNVLLDGTYEPLMTDYALALVINQSHASQAMIAYKSPESMTYGRVTTKSDVWSFGILILEILTGKYPGNYTRQGNGGADLANWVNSVVREEWTGEVFDGEMRRTRNAEGEMLNLLQIGLGCCEVDVEKRWELKRALQEIEGLKEKDADEDYSSFISEGEGSSSRAMTEDEFSFSTNN